MTELRKRELELMYESRMHSVKKRKLNEVDKRQSFNQKKENLKVKTFSRGVIVLDGPKTTKVPQKKFKLELEMKGHIINKVDFSSNMTSDEVMDKIRAMFGSKVVSNKTRLTFARNACNKLMPVTVGHQGLMDAITLKANYRKKQTVYMIPNEVIFTPTFKISEETQKNENEGTDECEIRDDGKHGEKPDDDEEEKEAKNEEDEYSEKEAKNEEDEYSEKECNEDENTNETPKVTIKNENKGTDEWEIRDVVKQGYKHDNEEKEDKSGKVEKSKDKESSIYKRQINFLDVFPIQKMEGNIPQQAEDDFNVSSIVSESSNSSFEEHASFESDLESGPSKAEDLITGLMIEYFKSRTAMPVTEQPDCANLMFFKSILSDMNRLPVKMQRQFKSQVMTIMNEYLDIFESGEEVQIKMESA